MKTLIIDAGHGGNDPGATYNGNIEKEYTLEATLYIQKRFKELGLTVDVTRDKDITLSVNERVNKIKEYQYCISNHFNAGGGSGVECIHSIYSDGEFEQTIIEEFEKAGYPVRPNPVYSKKNSQGKDYYYMHRLTRNCRTTIVEYDFVDGPQSKKIKDEEYRKGMYECVIRAICKRHGIDYKSTKTEETTNILYSVQVGVFYNKKNAIDMLNKLSKAGFEGEIIETIKEEQEVQKPLTEYYEKFGLKVIETNPDNVYVATLPGVTLRQFGIYGINGTWQNTAEAHLSRSIWGLVANKNGAIGANSYQNSPYGYKRGTIIYYQDGEIEVKRINNISEITKPIYWAIGGGCLIPDIIEEENHAEDIFRYTNHTGIGYKGDRVFLIVTDGYCTMDEFRDRVLKLELDAAIFLDGGGSTQMNYVSGKGVDSSRKLSHGIFLKKV